VARASQGGLSSKIHFMTGGRAWPLAWQAISGQRGDSLIPQVARLGARPSTAFDDTLAPQS
jgi:hypothetical protein